MTDENKQNKTERKHFDPRFNPRREFLTWVRDQFPELKVYASRCEEYSELKERIAEVHESAMTVLNLVMTRSDNSLRRYYADDLENLQAAYNARDIGIYARHLETFVDAIEVE